MGLQEDFISNLKYLRKERHLTQEKLAELCGTDTCYIGQIETNRRFPSFSFIEKIAAALGVEAYTLFIPSSESTAGAGGDGLSLEEIKNRLVTIELEIRGLVQNVSRTPSRGASWE